MLSKSIPSYAKNYKKEYTYLIDINKKCEKFIENLGQENVFNSFEAKKKFIVKAKIYSFSKFKLF